MCLHVSDESPTVRSLCLRGLVQVSVLAFTLFVLFLEKYSLMLMCFFSFHLSFTIKFNQP